MSIDLLAISEIFTGQKAGVYVETQSRLSLVRQLQTYGVIQSLSHVKPW